VLGPQAIDDRLDRRVRLLQLIEEVRVFGVMVRVDEAVLAPLAGAPPRGG
jgi:hypothetical protein